MKSGPLAQLAEHPAHNRTVPGSIPGGPTNYKRKGSEDLFERLREEYAGEIIAINFGTNVNLFRELIEQIDCVRPIRPEIIIENMGSRTTDYSVSIKMPEAGEQGRPKWDGWCETDWYRDEGYTVLDYESIFEAAQVFTPPQIPLWEETI